MNAVTTPSEPHLSPQCASDTERRIFERLGLGKRAVICPMENDDGTFAGVAIVYEGPGGEEQSEYLPFALVHQLWPDVEALEVKISKREEGEPWRPSKTKVTREPSIDRCYDDELCADVVSPSDAIRLALSYALTGHGEASFSLPDLDVLFEDCEVDVQQYRDAVVCYLHFMHREEGAGFGEHCYTFRPPTELGIQDRRERTDPRNRDHVGIRADTCIGLSR